MARSTQKRIASLLVALLLLSSMMPSAFAQDESQSFATLYASKALRVEKDEVPDDALRKTHHWTAYRGAEHISEEQFLRLVGNNSKAKRSLRADSSDVTKMNTGAAMFLFGGSVGLVGGLGMIRRSEAGHEPEWNEPSSLAFSVGTLVGIVGWSMMKDAIYRPKQISYDQAKMAAENYNDALRMEYGLHLMKQQEAAPPQESSSLQPIPNPEPEAVELPDSTQVKPRKGDDSLYLWID